MSQPLVASPDLDAPAESLARRWSRHVAWLTLTLLLASGAVEAYFSYREAREQLARMQALQAQAAAAEIEQYLAAIERSLAQVQALPWGRPGFGAPERRAELQRALALHPSVVEIRDLDGRGHEQLFVSRLEPDRLRGAPALALAPTTGPPADALDALDASATPALPVPSGTGYGSAFHSPAGEPMVRLAQAFQPLAPGVQGQWTVAVINLRFLADVASRLRVGDGGQVYVVDRTDQLVAHASATHVLRRLALGAHQPVQAARRALQGGARALTAIDGHSLDGQAVIVSAQPLQQLPGWLLFVEQPREEALHSAAATLQRSGLLLVAGGALALLASAAFARRMAAPIARLRAATARVAGGELGTRIELPRADEIGLLAADFNRMAEQVQRSHAELEGKVVERTQELAVRTDEAERANAAKTRFLAAASHDLRQPMHAIGLLVGLLQQRLRGGELATLAERAQDSVAAMEQLFSSLLDISKLDAGVVKPRLEVFALARVLQAVQAHYAPIAAEKGLRLRVRTTRAQVLSDPALVERMLGNLVANAIRYTPRGGVVVGCRRRGAQWRLQVVDSGIGIAPQHQQAVFDEFFRADPSAAADDKGLGLGLSIVQRTAHMLSHSIALRSRPGRGSVFELVMDAQPEPLALPAPAGEAPTTSTLAGCFVVLVDDDPRNLEALRVLFTQWQCHVLAAASAEAALAQLDEHLRIPDLLVADQRLGQGLSGRDFIAEARRRAETPVPALLLTADLELPVSALDPATQVLHKPAGVDRLQRAARSVLGSAVGEATVG